MSDFFRNLAEDIKDEDTSIAADGLSSSFILNAVMSGSIYGGVPNNKVTAFAGESATGKTFFVLGVVAQFLKDNPEGGVVFYDTEAAVTKDMMESRGVDTERLIIAEPDTIQKFRTHALNVIEQYEKTPEAKRPPMMMVLDSLGLLSTQKEIEDSTSGKEVRDMTKSQLIKGAFRVLTLKLAKVNVPMLVTNHVYELIGSYIPTKEMGGGSGLKYAASTIAYLGKKKERDGTDIVGIIIKVKMFKSRLSKENKTVEVLLRYDTGLDRYYGMVDAAIEAGVWNKSANRVDTPQGKVYPKAIYKDPEKYFTEEVMMVIDQWAKNEFSYGMVNDREDNTVESDSE